MLFCPRHPLFYEALLWEREEAVASVLGCVGCDGDAVYNRAFVRFALGGLLMAAEVIALVMIVAYVGVTDVGDVGEVGELARLGIPWCNLSGESCLA